VAERAQRPLGPSLPLAAGVAIRTTRQGYVGKEVEDHSAAQRPASALVAPLHEQAHRGCGIARGWPGPNLMVR
jgi:hypothetical protein